MSVQSVERALLLLEEVAREPSGLAQAASATGLPISTASRLLGTLEARGAVARGADGVYSLGTMIARLTGSVVATPTIQAAAHPVLATLADELGEAACLSIPIGLETLTITQIDAPKPVQAQDWTGHRWAITGGTGVAMMATWPTERVGPLIERLDPADRQRVVSEIAEASSTGMCWSHGVHVDGLSSIAAPVCNDHGHAVAAIVGYGPSYRFPSSDRTASIERVVKQAAFDVATNMEI